MIISTEVAMMKRRNRGTGQPGNGVIGESSGKHFPYIIDQFLFFICHFLLAAQSNAEPLGAETER
jgi:hypothetical protein